MHLPIVTFFTVGAVAACPSKAEITSIFSYLTSAKPSFAQFFDHVAPTVHWTIEGTHPAAGTYTNRTILEGTFARIAAVASASDPFRFTLINVIADEAWSVQELSVTGTCKNGLVFDNRYAWATRWNGTTIVEARAYLDSALVSAALQQNEGGTLFTYKDNRNEMLPFAQLTAQQVDGATGLRRKSSS